MIAKRTREMPDPHVACDRPVTFGREMPTSKFREPI